MPHGKKKKSSSKKNNKKQKKPIPLEDVLSQAESAMEMSDVNTALQLFAYASGILRSQLQVVDDGAPLPSSDCMQQENNTSHHHQVQVAETTTTQSTLSTVLGKMGELKASNGDVDGSRSDFLEAIELLGPSTALANDTKMEAIEENDSNSNIINNNNNTIQTAQTHETRASLHLYLGQLSLGNEALVSLRCGVQELEYAVSTLQHLVNDRSAKTTEEKDYDVNMEGNEKDDEEMMVGTVNLKQMLAETRRQLCAAHCSIAELYLTDLCEEPDAESKCEAALKSALALDDDEEEALSSTTQNDGGGGGRRRRRPPPSPDALQTMSNFRLSQSRVPEALECILKAYDRMKVGCEAMSALVGLGNHTISKGVATSNENDVEVEQKASELVDVEAASSLPEYNFRCQTAKIMLECASLLDKNDRQGNTMINQCAESAIQVLGSLMAENDEVIEVWYLLGCAFQACTPSNEELAIYYWKRAHEMLTKVKCGLEMAVDDGEDDDNAENELEAIMCQINEVEHKLKANLL